jgi:uncharacterized protein YgiB involved in biofilm formation
MPVRKFLSLGSRHRRRLEGRTVSAASLSLALLLASANAIGLSACGDPVPKAQAEERLKIYPDVKACQAENGAEACQQAFGAAQQQHAETAQHYPTMASCEALYGPQACVPQHSGAGDVFIPLMMGFMLGHALSGPAVIGTPVYFDRYARVYTGPAVIGTFRCGTAEAYGHCQQRPFGSGFGYVYRSSSPGFSSTIWTSHSYSVQTISTPVSRGGFGGSAALGSKPLSGGGRVGVASGSVSRGGFGGTSARMASAGGHGRAGA